MRSHGSQRNAKRIMSITPLPKSSVIFSEFSTQAIKTTQHSSKCSNSKFLMPSSIDIYTKSSTNIINHLPTKLEVLDKFAVTQSNDYTLGSPATRRDVQELASWLNSMLKKALDSSSEPVALYDTANTIYKVCFCEVIRQVKVQCKERGELIKKIWETYQILFHHAIKITQTRQDYIEKLHVNEKYNLEKHFEKQLNDLISANTELSKKSQKLETEMKIKEEAFKIRDYREKKLMQALDIFKQQYSALKEELLIVKEENRIFNIRIENMQNIKTKTFRKYKPKDVDYFKSTCSSDPIVNYQEHDEADELIKRISQYGNKY